ncbi:unnamed protein product [Pleuronectes platessa]|uniref:Uncharacterized protein n=1 Tax=Pleuronectes platessa TaxID=8262 RepID=A0A9N7V452_PLEPL|nr:unnamed protein product [Pleuronectes platessa]
MFEFSSLHVDRAFSRTGTSLRDLDSSITKTHLNQSSSWRTDPRAGTSPSTGQGGSCGGQPLYPSDYYTTACNVPQQRAAVARPLSSAAGVSLHGLGPPPRASSGETARLSGSH